MTEPLTGRQLGARKNRLNALIAEHEGIVRRWKTYAPDDYLERAIAGMEAKLTELRAERAELDSHMKESDSAEKHLR